MKKLLFTGLAALLLSSCSGAKVTVKNPTASDRAFETIELAWADVTAKLPEATPDNIRVAAPDGQPLTHQILYHGGDTPQALIFQASVPAGGKITYRLSADDQPCEPPITLAHGRFVPERMDDFAWENNRIAFRMYGPALEATGELSNGIDVWLKKPDAGLIIDKWYTTPGYNYHRNNGQGLDCYKVGRTLGAGAMAPYEDRQLWLGKNYVSYKVLDNGPLRIAFELTYAPFAVRGDTIAEKRTISLDANSSFNRITELYTGPMDSLRVAVGVVLRSGGGGRVIDFPQQPIHKMGYWEPQNNDNGDNNGRTAIGVITPKGILVETRLGHLLGSTTIKVGEPFTYWAGAGWSLAQFDTSAKWTEEIQRQEEAILHPLIVTLK